MRYLFIIISLFISYYSKADSWTQKADFPNGSRYAAFAFSIGNKGYVGGGLDWISDTSKSDFWEYDPSTDTWTRKADFPGLNGAYAASFSIGGKGYVCTGVGLYTTTQFYKNTWEYDPSTDTWAQKPYFPGTARSSAVAFVIDSIAYVGIGLTNSIIFKDFYAYNPSTNLWNAIASLPDSGSDGTAFSILNKGYVTGLDRVDFPSGHDVSTQTLWQYDPIVDSWTAKASFPDTGRFAATSFAINNMGYFGMGLGTNGPTFNDLWQYNPATDTWLQQTSLPSTGRDASSYFVIGNYGYSCFGGLQYPNQELWQYSLFNLQVEQVNKTLIETKAFPNPFTNSAKITFSQELNNGEIIVSDMYGKQVVDYKNINCKEFLLYRNDMTSGVYFYIVKEKGITVTRDKIVVE